VVLRLQGGAPMPQVVVISNDNFSTAAFPWGTNFTGTNPLPDKSGEAIGSGAPTTNIDSPHPSGYMVSGIPGDTIYLRDMVPDWHPPAGAPVTRPWSVPLLFSLAQAVHAGAKPGRHPPCRVRESPVCRGPTRVPVTLRGVACPAYFRAHGTCYAANPHNFCCYNS
jgi:hypothetical protein